MDFIFANEHLVAKATAIGFFMMIALFAWTIPRSEIYMDAPSQAGWRDLRVWGSLAMCMMALAYYTYG